VQQKRAVADAFDGGEIVRDQHNGFPNFPQLFHPLEAPSLKGYVTNSQNFVKEQDVGVEMHRYRESQSKEHSRRILLYWNINEICDFSKLNDTWNIARYLAICHP
jgi:hypothetical protein